MTVDEAQKLAVTAIRLVRVHAESLEMFDADGEPKRIAGLELDALLADGRMPQAVWAAAFGAVSVDEVKKLLSHLKDVMWDAVGAEQS